MKITETIERECCVRDKDFLIYQGTYDTIEQGTKARVEFCCHCGQIWIEDALQEKGTARAWRKAEPLR